MYGIFEYIDDEDAPQLVGREPWNKHKLVGQKKPLKLKEVWEIRIRLKMAGQVRNLALFNLAIDSKLRSCDLVKLRIAEVTHAGQLASRAKVMQQKTGVPVQSEISPETRDSISAWLDTGERSASDFLFPSRLASCDHLSTRQYARLLKGWIDSIGLHTGAYDTHSMRRTKATLIYLSPHKEPANCPIAAGPHKAGTHGSLPWD